MKTLQLLTTTIITATLTSGAYALPTGGQVTSGTASIVTAGKKLDVTQSTSRVDINWKDFSSAAGETINFNQKASDIAVNRVTGGQASVLNGLLTAQGKVVLINDAGITIGKTGQVNTGALSLIASKVSDFSNNVSTYNNSLKSATIDNQGKITTNGDVVMFGTNVKNEGTITANAGATDSSITLTGADVTNTGNLSASFVGINNADTAKLSEGSQSIAYSNKGTAAQTINAGGNITAKKVDLSSAVSATNEYIAKSTINLNGVIDTTELSAKGTDINYYSSTKGATAYTNLNATHDVNLKNTSVISSGYTTLIASNNTNLDGNITAAQLEIKNGNDTNLTGSAKVSYTSLTAGRDVNISGSLNKGDESSSKSNELVEISAGRDINLKSTARISASAEHDSLSEPTSPINPSTANGTPLLLDPSQTGITLTAGRDFNALKDSSINGGLVHIKALNNINFDGNIGSNANPILTDAFLEAEHNITTGSNSAIVATGISSLLSYQGNSNLNGSLNGSLINVYANNDINLSDTSNTNAPYISLSANHDVNINGDISGSHYLDYNNQVKGQGSTDTLRVYAGNNLNFGASSYIFAENETNRIGVDFYAVNDINLNGYIASTSYYNIATAPVGISVLAEHDLNIGETFANTASYKGAQYTAMHDLNFNGSIYANSDNSNPAIGLKAGNDLNLGVKSRLSSDQGLVDLSSSKGDITVKGSVYSQDQVKIASGKDLFISGDIRDNQYSDQEVTQLTAKGNAVINGYIQNSEGVTLTANSVNLSDGTIDSSKYVSQYGSPLNTAGNISIHTKKYIDNTNTMVKANSDKGGTIIVSSSGVTNFKGNYQANGTKTAGSVYLYGSGRSTVSAAKVSTFSGNKAAKKFYYKTGGKVYVVYGDGK